MQAGGMNQIGRKKDRLYIFSRFKKNKKNKMKARDDIYLS
jgi:hypothetical protein